MVANKAKFHLVSAMVVMPCLAIAEVEIPEHDTAPVLEQHQTCSTDNECMLIQRECSDCDCGTPVNLKYSNIYQEEKKKRCENYKGAVCDLICPTTKSVCRTGKCAAK